MTLSAFWSVGCEFEGEQKALSEARFVMYPAILELLLLYFSLLNNVAKVLRRRIPDTPQDIGNSTATGSGSFGSGVVSRTLSDAIQICRLDDPRQQVIAFWKLSATAIQKVDSRWRSELRAWKG